MLAREQKEMQMTSATLDADHREYAVRKFSNLAATLDATPEMAVDQLLSRIRGILEQGLGISSPLYPVSDAPKPFTPNKYTRTLHSLDGRKVPVDVYCVLAAFPTGSAAVDHAVKKQLAPGQRGTKSRLQDLKEAYASLGRAIELEEGQDASP